MAKETVGGSGPGLRGPVASLRVRPTPALGWSPCCAGRCATGSRRTGAGACGPFGGGFCEAVILVGPATVTRRPGLQGRPECAAARHTRDAADGPGPARGSAPESRFLRGPRFRRRCGVSPALLIGMSSPPLWRRCLRPSRSDTAGAKDCALLSLSVIAGRFLAPADRRGDGVLRPREVMGALKVAAERGMGRLSPARKSPVGPLR